ncbi:MAG: acyl-CoA dehydrogenase family protein [Bacillota bacterium]|nr:acyl-CoA dehydrogenase family protein [Bacillota bacterium]
MDHRLSEDEITLRELAARVAREKIAPVAAELDEREEFPRRILEEIGRAGLMGLTVPERYGGMGLGHLATCLVIEELSRACAGVGVTYAASILGYGPILLFGTEEHKGTYLPSMCTGEGLGAFALTEPQAGSDAAAIRCTAVPRDGGYVISGTKQWITNGGEASLYTIIALTAPQRGPRGASALIVPAGTPGLSYGRKEKKLGIRCSATRELVFDECFVPAANLLGREGQGFIIAMRNLNLGRPGVAAQALGIAQAALDHSVRYSLEREQFGQPIGRFQAVGHMLADMATHIEAARSLVYAVARAIDSGDQDFEREAAMAKTFASDTAMAAATDAVQIFGGYGYMRDYPVEKLFRDAKITQIYEGTNQVQRNIIAASLLKEAARR